MELNKSFLEKESDALIGKKTDAWHTCTEYATLSDYEKKILELNSNCKFYYSNKDELMKTLEQRIDALESQNDRLLYFLHYLYDNFPDLVKNMISSLDKQPVQTEVKEKCNYPCITRREEEILALLGKGLCAKEIARQLFISETTVITHKKNLKEKFHARNSVELISKSSGNTTKHT